MNLNELSVVVAAVGVAVTAIQIALTVARDTRAKRPVIVLRLQTITRNNETRLYLTIVNVGMTPAKNVWIDFEPGKDWNWVQHPTYPFLREQGGIPVIQTSEELQYFLGVVKPKGKLLYLKNSSISATASSDRPLSWRRYKDVNRLTLAQEKYISKA